ncbi:35778_t:CDS:1, partial [Racocetra persica]
MGGVLGIAIGNGCWKNVVGEFCVGKSDCWGKGIWLSGKGDCQVNGYQ